jgi:Tol biopolymer transport system component/predicted Ser/Thr protein kinase
MSFEPGTRLGPYEVVRPLGAGGMGEVYEARDPRLQRLVAIKVLPPRLRADADLLARFRREAQALSSLSHPHVCPVYDVGCEGDVDFLVMERLEGETLQRRLERGGMPVDEVLQVAVEVAGALDAAHRRGIVHRDLKPGNVMLTKVGAKLLDFGLARLRSAGAPDLLSSAPTATTPNTAAGTLLGTLPYMAPEQLEGREADARTDVFAFGAVLHEMATGQRAFAGNSQASLVAAILEKQPPPISTLRPLAPAALDRVVRTCLAKDPDERWQSAADLRLGLAWIAEGAEAGAPQRELRRRPWRLPVLAGLGLAAALAGGLVGRALAPRPPEPAIVHSLLDLRPAEALIGPHALERTVGMGRPSRTALALSPDGRRLAFVAREGEGQRLYVRALDEAEARPLAGTEGADNPFFSPEGRAVGFWSAGAIRRVAVDGGPPVEVCPSASLVGATWPSPDEIVFATTTGGLMRVAPGAGRPEPLTRLSPGEVSHRLPHALPGGALLFTVFESGFDKRQGRVEVLDRAAGRRLPVADNAADARYVRTGHVVFARRGTLVAIPFDPSTLRARGAEVGVVDGVMQSLNVPYVDVETGAAQFDVADDGTLAYAPGGVVPDVMRRLVRVDRSGRVEPLAAPAKAGYAVLQLSPDGRRVAVTAREGLTWSLWVYDLERGTMTRPAPSPEGAMLWPRWRPDGRQLAFSWSRRDETDLWVVDADGSGAPEAITRTRTMKSASGWAPDGRSLVYAESGDIVLLERDGGGWTSRPLLASPAAETGASVSPDGRWVAYASDETGRDEVYLQRFPELGGKVQVSTSGGYSPVWSRDGRELFYAREHEGAYTGDLWAVTVGPGPEPRLGTPRRLFSLDERRLWNSALVSGFDVAADGRFYFPQTLESAPSAEPRELQLVLGWSSELRRRVPAGDR